MPRVLIPIAAYNASPWLSEALSSIENQTYEDWVCFVMDDASTDNSHEVAKRFAARDKRFRVGMLYKNYGFGPALTRAIDAGIMEAADIEGLGGTPLDYIALHGGDDYSEPVRLEKQVAFMDANPWCKVLGTWFRELRPDGSEGIATHVCSPEAIRHVLTHQGTAMGHGTVMMRTEVWQEIHGFSESMAQDYEWLQRVEDKWPCSMRNLEEVLYTWRRHPKQISQVRIKEVVEETGRLVMEAQMKRKPLVAGDFAEGKIRLDIGSGGAPPPGYLHADLAPAADIELVAPLTDIPLPDKSCSEIRLSHILEHQAFAELTIVMAEMRRLLADDAKLIIMVPNLTYVCEKFAQAKTLEEQKPLMPELYGLQSGKFEFHLWGFTRATLRELLEAHGFHNISIDQSCWETVRCEAFKGEKPKPV